MKNIYIIMIVFICLLFSNAISQDYHLNVRAGAGYSRFMTDLDYPGINKSGFIGTFRVMWQPEHLLQLGLESGYNSLYTYEESGVETEFGKTDATSSLTAVPLFLVISMHVIDGASITAGFGPSFLTTSFESFDLQTNSSQSSTSYFVAGEYQHFLTNKISIGGDLRWYYIQKIEDGTLSLNVTLGYQLLSW